VNKIDPNAKDAASVTAGLRVDPSCFPWFRLLCPFFRFFRFAHCRSMHKTRIMEITARKREKEREREKSESAREGERERGEG